MGVAKRGGGKSSSPTSGRVANGGDGALPASDYRHGGPGGARRKNNPPAKIAAEGDVPVIPKAQYAYNPHLPPVLRFDQHGQSDALPPLLEKARRGPLTEDETALLAEALRRHEPWLEWTGKRERPAFSVDPVALHIHERVSAQAILKVAARQDVSKSLFADPEQEYREAVQFYRHDIDWSNRLILGDSLQVMSSLARREDLAGKVQMIYLDPPYGIKFASNFQPEVGKRDVKDKQEDLTREPEMVRAYRDTWHLGIHSYLSYLRDRLIVVRELLADTGSIFVQISDENLHRVRDVMDEVFGAGQFCGLIAFRKTTTQAGDLLPSTNDFLLWYASDRTRIRFRPLFQQREGHDWVNYDYLALPSGEHRRMLDGEAEDASRWPNGTRVYRRSPLTSTSSSESTLVPVEFAGQVFKPGRGGWKTNASGFGRLRSCERLESYGVTLSYRRYTEDFPFFPIADTWTDTASGGYGDPKVYVVQTNAKVIQRCMLMTTDPGDLVLDPTCGSGTTAYVAEQWGRRWITTDTSRVAIAIARQRLLTAKFEQYRVRESGVGNGRSGSENPRDGFHYKTVPHIALKSIAQNAALDPIFTRHEPKLDAALKAVNASLAKVTPELRVKLAGKLAAKEKAEGKRAVTDADRRRWVLPPENRDPKVKWTVDAKFGGWYHWEAPFDTDPDWPKALAEAVTAYRAAWRAKMDEVNACVAASAEQEELVDQPEVVRGITRVSGPFTVEAVQPPEMSLGDVAADGAEAEFAGAPDPPDGTGPVFQMRMVERVNELEVHNVGAYLDQMFRFIYADGVRFLNNKQMKWSRLEPLFEQGTGRGASFHAEGRWTPVGEKDSDPEGGCNVGVVFGPQYGPVTAKMVEESIRAGNRAGYDAVVVAGFSFDGAATGIISENEDGVPGKGGKLLRVHLAHIRPDINPGMNGLLKESPQPGGGQLFTVFGQPRITVRKSKAEEGLLEVEMEGVDIYDPARDETRSSGADKVAAWFLDSDYDGRTFCITQAFFPDRGAWEKLAKALNGKDGPIDAERFEAFSGTVSLPFPVGKNKCVAVKVIDPRGNEVMAVENL